MYLLPLYHIRIIIGLIFFVLFSLEDPCPYVVLENLLVGNRVLAFRDSIYTHHHVPGLYFEYPGSISFQTAQEHIRMVCTTRHPATSVWVDNISKHIIQTYRILLLQLSIDAHESLILLCFFL